MTAQVIALSRRGTSNSNVRGSSESRRRRREWLIYTYRANQDLFIDRVEIGGEWFDHPRGVWLDCPDIWPTAKPACRCYRCGVLLTVDTVTVDRIVPGIEGGTYRRNNIRPACGTCNSSTGGALAAARRTA